jgi:peptidoglycan L-alanyl-D-glutamate endopeptidase CwlK
MSFAFGQKSLAELVGVHPELVAVVHLALSYSEVDFAVHDGIRTEAEQRELVRIGASQTMQSLHLPQIDGLGRAVDLVPVINGKLRWEWMPIYYVAAAMRRAAQELHAHIVWGGCWDHELNSTSETPEAMRHGYEERRAAIGKRAFLDGPHYEIHRPNVKD